MRRLWFVLVVSLIFLVLNLFVRQSGVVDDTFTDENSKEYKENQRIKKFSSVDPFFFIFRPERSLKELDLEHVLEFSEELEKFPWAKDRIAGPANIPLIKVGKDEYGFKSVSFDPAIIRGTKLKELKNAVEKSSVYQDKFFSFKKGDGVVIVPILLSPDSSQSEVYWDVVEFLEGREVSNWKRFFYNGIQPRDEWKDWRVAGWAIARQSLDISLLKDNLTLNPIGFVLGFIFGCFLLHSWRHSFIMLLQMIMVFIWTRGSIALLGLTGIRWPGLPTTENIYILVAAIIWLVQGASFTIHRFQSFYETSSWDDKNIKQILGWITIISVLSLLSLLTFNVRVIREIGPLSALAIGYLYLIVMHIQPALYQLFCKGEVVRSREFGSFSFLRKLDELLVYNWLVKRLVVISSFVLIGLALFFIQSGRIIVNTRALDFIKDTDVYGMMTWLRDDGRFGNEVIEVGVEGEITNPLIFSKTQSFVKKLEELKGVNETVSIVDAISDLEEADLLYALADIEDGTSEVLFRNLVIEGGFKITLTTNRASSSQELYSLIQEVRGLGEKQGLEVFLGGKSVAWAVQERDIRRGKIINTGIDMILLILWGSMFVWFMNKKSSRLLLSDANHQANPTPWRMGLILIIPLLFSSAIIITALVLLRVDFNQAVAVIMAFTINAAADFLFFPIAKFVEFQRVSSRDDIEVNVIATMSSVGGVVVKDAIINILLFTPLIFASFEPIKEIGIITVIMLLATMLGARIITPCLLPWGVRSN